jgi:hypothetical protein
VHRHTSQKACEEHASFTILKAQIVDVSMGQLAISILAVIIRFGARIGLSYPKTPDIINSRKPNQTLSNSQSTYHTISKLLWWGG